LTACLPQEALTAADSSKEPIDVLASETAPASDAFGAVAPGVLREIRRVLVEQESAYRLGVAEAPTASLWAHSARVGRIAGHIARQERLEPLPALLAGLMHDLGKFAHGRYHEDDVPEERHAAPFVEKILAGTDHAGWIESVRRAILTMCLEGDAVSDVGRVVYDADCLGVAQFFTKRTLRCQFLGDDVMMRASVELTYAHHAPETLKTATGRALAGRRVDRTRRFYTELLEEWSELGLGAFDIVEEDIGGVACILVVPRRCSCGGRVTLGSDIRDEIKCRSLVVSNRCEGCGGASEYSFCLPNVQGLPPKRR
jgi:hypothetical protein